jgi:hypothetical protein
MCWLIEPIAHPKSNDIWVWSIGEMLTGRLKKKYLENNLLIAISPTMNDMDCPTTESDPRQWETSAYTPELAWSQVAKLFKFIGQQSKKSLDFSTVFIYI